MRQGALKVHVSFTAASLTHFGGVYLLHQFLQQLRLRSFLYRTVPFAQRNNRYTLSELLVAHLYPMILGLEKIEVSALLKTNGVFQYLTGLPSFPDPTTLRRFLGRSALTVAGPLRAAHNVLRSRFLALPHARSSYWLDFDSTVRTLYGNQEGATKGYNPHHPGKKSYHPLICTEAHLRDCLGGELRHGNAHTAAGVDEMFNETLSLLPATRREVRVRADAGFYNGDFVGKLSEKRIRFAVVAHVTAPLQRKVPGLRYSRISNELSGAECRYQPHGWKVPYRFVVLREKLTAKRREQLTLFTVTPYAYHILVTNLPLTPYGAFAFYEDRTGQERIVRTLKDEYPFGSAPTHSFAANALYAELSLLAYNLIVWFRRLCLPEDWQPYTVETLRHRLLMIPGVFTKTGNRPVLKLPKNNPYREVFTHAQSRIETLEPLVPTAPKDFRTP